MNAPGPPQGARSSATLIAAVALSAIALVVSTLVIYPATKLFRQSEGVDTALPTALVGALVPTLFGSLWTAGPNPLERRTQWGFASPILVMSES